MSFLGFLFPVMVIMNVIYGGLWLFFKKRLAAISLVSLLITLPFILRTVTLSVPGSADASHIKVMTYNVKSFDLYNWSHNLDTREKMMQLIEQQNADILCLQEFYNDTAAFKNIAVIKKRMGYPYVHYGQTVYMTDHKLPRSWGVITFSKFPIIEKGTVDFHNTETNACIWSDILLKDSVIRVYNMHLQSVHLGYDDYKYIDQVADNQDADMNATKRIVRKLRKAYLKRSHQADEIAESIGNSPHRVLVCGDFNDTPVSYTYEKIADDLQDAFVQKGNGIGQTFVSKAPLLRIDYVLASPGIKFHTYRCIRKELSDHFPVIVELSQL